jgi:hypothetical protein
MKKVFGALILAGLIAMMFSPLTISKPILPEYKVDPAPVFVDVYTTPSHVIGADWASGRDGDIINVYANVTGNYPDEVYIWYGFCNRATCINAPGITMMNYLGGTMYNFTLPGDSDNGWDFYEASSNVGSDIYFYLFATSPNSDNEAYYPGPDDTYLEHIYPAWPPKQFNATSALSSTTMYTGETFWVNGTSNYWNSTSYPQDFSTLLPADECPVTVKVGTTPFNGKTNVWGNYSVQVTAPSTPGQYTVNTTVSNATANRNVTCKAAEYQIQVKSHKLNISLEMNATTTLPSQPLWANGTVKLDGAAVPAGYVVNVSIVGGDFWLANTDASGDYSAQITTPNAVGQFTVNATVKHAGFGLEAWNETDITVVAVPVPDLKIENSNIKVIGNLVEGQNLKLNATVFNAGIAAATNVMVNITLDNVLLNSSRRTIAVGANATISLNWKAVSGKHYLNVSADPMNTTAESSETNNKAGITFTIQPDNDHDGIGDDVDPDDDNDGVPDTSDAFPFDPNEWVDTDGDGIGNNADPDDDNDGYNDAVDAFPLDPTEWNDTDNDGIGDNTDPDIDGDGVPNGQDVFPYDAAESADFDGDGIGDNADTDDDSDGIPDNVDPFPWDTDNDGLNNDVDSDDDGDGIPDATDQYPLDTDNDGLNNDVDTDDDGDGIPDSEDAFPLDPTEWNDTDGDGIGDNSDPDIDGDGVPNADDPDPYDPAITELEGGNNMMIVAGVVIAIVVVIALLAYMFVIRPKMK